MMYDENINKEQKEEAGSCEERQHQAEQTSASLDISSEEKGINQEQQNFSSVNQQSQQQPYENPQYNSQPYGASQYQQYQNYHRQQHCINFSGKHGQHKRQHFQQRKDNGYNQMYQSLMTEKRDLCQMLFFQCLPIYILLFSVLLQFFYQTVHIFSVAFYPFFHIHTPCLP